ncbi:hypothetical protein HDC94_000932 [Leifsonia sp. AK011]|nr:hypothetical protein [Leifsonia sp. AK011]
MQDRDGVPPEDIDDSVWAIVDESAKSDGAGEKLNG